MSFDLRKPCLCGSPSGRIESRTGQDCVFCLGCGKFQYNAPKTETGRAVRSIQTTHEAITPKLRARILERATGRCEVCGSDKNLHVGHIVSVKHGQSVGMSDAEINDEENLMAMCEECNLGFGERPLPVRFIVKACLLRTRMPKQ